MSDSTAENGASRSIPTATAVATGTGDDAASAAEKRTGATGEDSTASAPNAKRNTGNTRKRQSEPLPVSDALKVFQEAARMLQEAGLPVQPVQLPVSDGAPPRVAVILANCRYENGDLVLA